MRTRRSRPTRGCRSWRSLGERSACSRSAMRARPSFFGLSSGLNFLLGLPRRTPLSVPIVVLGNGAIWVKASIVAEGAMIANRSESLAYWMHWIVPLVVPKCLSRGPQGPSIPRTSRAELVVPAVPWGSAPPSPALADSSPLVPLAGTDEQNTLNTHSMGSDRTPSAGRRCHRRRR